MIPPTSRKPAIVLRASGGPSILKELSNEQIAVDIEDAVRLNAAARRQSRCSSAASTRRSRSHNMTRLVDAGMRYGMPVLGVTAVGKDMVRDAQYFRLACRICAELGAHYVKTYYVEEGFETVTASCPVPIVMAGGKKLPELDALTMAYNAVAAGRRRRRHGPQHLPVRRADGHDPGRRAPSSTTAPRPPKPSTSTAGSRWATAARSRSIAAQELRVAARPVFSARR